MQCSYDSKGNSVPTILLLMQEALYIQGGMKVGESKKISEVACAESAHICYVLVDEVDVALPFDEHACLLIG
jgi:hypothetical protein